MLKKQPRGFIYVDRAQTEQQLNLVHDRGIYFTCVWRWWQRSTLAFGAKSLVFFRKAHQLVGLWRILLRHNWRQVFFPRGANPLDVHSIPTLCCYWCLLWSIKSNGLPILRPFKVYFTPSHVMKFEQFCRRVLVSVQGECNFWRITPSHRTSRLFCWKALSRL